MKISLNTIKRITSGAVRIEENDKGISFYRFTKAQEEYYKEVSLRQERSFYDRCMTTAGVKLSFRTDSKNMTIRGFAEKKTSRYYYSFDVFVNGAPIGFIDNFSGKTLPKDYTEFELPIGEFSGEFSLGEGTKEVAVYFPWSVAPTLTELSLDDGSTVEEIKKEKKLLAFGDSITQGYDALRPSNRYVSRLAALLDVEEINKGIGGEYIVPELAELTDDFKPDYITVAYGTNDWSKKTEEDFRERAKRFYEILSQNYPDSIIFAISPIWRRDFTEKREFGLFENVEKGIVDAVKGLKNVHFISGFNLVRHDENYFGDLRLHPSCDGFKDYSENLYKEIKKKI